MPEKRLFPVYKRQRFLLDFIGQIANGATATDLQKLVFLYSKTNNIEHYEFVPYRFGPYSFQLAEDLEILQRDEFIEYNGLHYLKCTASTTGIDVNLPKERGDKLLKKVYLEYPYYAINSEILSRLFKAQEMERFILEKKRHQRVMQLLFTIGYEGKSLESFINLLIQNDVRLLCDVRKNPLSRKFGFSKAKLEHVLKAIGIEYIHIPEVGIDAEKRAALTTRTAYDLLFQDYENNLPQITSYLERIALLCNKYQRVALMCYEEDPQECHRHIIRDYLVRNHNAICEDL